MTLRFRKIELKNSIIKSWIYLHWFRGVSQGKAIYGHAETNVNNKCR